MEITIFLHEEDVRRILEQRIEQEISKHGHRSDFQEEILVSLPGKTAFPLSELKMCLGGYFKPRSLTPSTEGS